HDVREPLRPRLDPGLGQPHAQLLPREMDAALERALDHRPAPGQHGVVQLEPPVDRSVHPVDARPGQRLHPADVLWQDEVPRGPEHVRVQDSGVRERAHERRIIRPLRAQAERPLRDRVLLCLRCAQPAQRVLGRGDRRASQPLVAQPLPGDAMPLHDPRACCGLRGRQTPGRPPITLMLKCGVPSRPYSRTQSGRNISVARAVVMSPRSITLPRFQPNHCSSHTATCALLVASLPLRNSTWSPGTSDGSTITPAFTVFSVLTTRVSGNARWICSASESVLHTVRHGGMPCEKSSGYAMSIRNLRARFSRPACSSASSEPLPVVQLNTVSPNAAASRCVPCDALGPISCAHAMARSLSGVREPIRTSCPSPTSFVPIVLPTTPVPRTAMRMSASTADSSVRPTVHDA